MSLSPMIPFYLPLNQVSIKQSSPDTDGSVWKVSFKVSSDEYFAYIFLALTWFRENRSNFALLQMPFSMKGYQVV